MRLLYVILAILLLASCQQQPTPQRKWQQLKTASFTELLKHGHDFIETPYFDSICGRLNDTIATGYYQAISLRDSINYETKILDDKYSVRISKDKPLLHKCGRQVFDICITEEDSVLFVESEKVNYHDFKNLIKDYILNPRSDDQYSEHYILDIEGIGEASVSKGIIGLYPLYDKENMITKKIWKSYFATLNDLFAVYRELKEEFALHGWGKNYAELTFNQQAALTRLYPLGVELFFWENCGIYPIVIPSSEEIDEILRI